MLTLSQLIPRPKWNGETSVNLSPAQLTRKILDQFTHKKPLENLNVRLWDQSMWPDEQPKPATLVLKRPSALREILLAGSETGIGESYLKGAFEVEGSMEAAFELADQIMEDTQGWTQQIEIAGILKRLPEASRFSANASPFRAENGIRHSPSRDHEAIQFHYDVSNEFYALWLGKQMTYSCAYFQDPSVDLETAQNHKLDLICRKLGLRPGQRFLDIGCGWGGLVLYAAEHYGVHAEGITLSEQQLWHAQQAVHHRGLEKKVTLHLRDYRDLRETEGYDAISSIGMVEHVGRENLPLYFEKVWRLLKQGGLFLNHGIGLGPIRLLGKSGTFIQNHVFPDSDLISIGDMLKSAEPQTWEIRDVESLREHYALTLRCWIHRLEAAHDRALNYVDESTYRIWRLYMSGCAHNFQTGRLSIYQTLLAKLNPNGTSRSPLIRASWYK